MKPYYADESVTLWHGDALEVLQGLPDGSVDCCVTSPPYFGLRDYGVAGQYGLEASPAEYVATMARLFGEVRRVLAVDGTLWLNIGDTYSSTMKGSGGTAKVTLAGPATGAYFEPRKVAPDRPAKNLLGIPWRTAFALQDDGWTLRNAIIWHKSNAMPESVTDRLSGRYEQVFLLSKSARYWFDLDSIREPSEAVAKPRTATETWHLSTGLPKHNGHRGTTENGRNPGDVWTIPTSPFPGSHFAVQPMVLAERCIQAGCKPGGTVLDPFSGSGTTGLAASRHGRKYVGIDLNADYLDLSLRTRLAQSALIEDVS